MTLTLETTTSALWPQSPLPHPPGTAWQWQVTTLRQLSSLRADLRSRLRSIGRDDARGNGDPVVDRILLAVDELASNALRHGGQPVHARVMTTADGWLIDISDAATGQAPRPAVGRDPALGGMGLHLVAELSTGHGWVVEAGRKHVWASLPLDVTDRTPWPSREHRSVDQPRPRRPENHTEDPGQFPSRTGRTVLETPTCEAVAADTSRPGTGYRRQERQSPSSAPSAPPSRAGRWATLIGMLAPQGRALANARNAVERDLRAAADREEANRVFTAAAGPSRSRSVQPMSPPPARTLGAQAK